MMSEWRVNSISMPIVVPRTVCAHGEQVVEDFLGTLQGTLPQLLGSRAPRSPRSYINPKGYLTSYKLAFFAKFLNGPYEGRHGLGAHLDLEQDHLTLPTRIVRDSRLHGLGSVPVNSDDHRR